jgi:hypothetical protein
MSKVKLTHAVSVRSKSNTERTKTFADLRSSFLEILEKEFSNGAGIYEVCNIAKAFDDLVETKYHISSKTFEKITTAMDDFVIVVLTNSSEPMFGLLQVIVEIKKSSKETK